MSGKKLGLGGVGPNRGYWPEKFVCLCRGLRWMKSRRGDVRRCGRCKETQSAWSDLLGGTG